VRLARMAQRSGLDGVVASPLEIEAIRETCDSFVILTPGIRGPGDDTGDQSRTLTAAEAIRRGATYIVVGRPITGASDPRAAALRLLDTIG
jgi:orotidine-5'-phosphate decarboxylase